MPKFTIDINYDIFVNHVNKLINENECRNMSTLSALIMPEYSRNYLNGVISSKKINRGVVNRLIEKFDFPPEAFKFNAVNESEDQKSEKTEPKDENSSIIAIEMNTATLTVQNREIIALLKTIAKDKEEEPANIYPMIVSNAKPNNVGMNQNTLAAYNEIKQKRYTEIYLGSGQKTLSDQPHVLGILNLIARNGFTLVMTPALNENGRPFIAVMLYNGDGSWPHGFEGEKK